MELLHLPIVFFLCILSNMAERKCYFHHTLLFYLTLQFSGLRSLSIYIFSIQLGRLMFLELAGFTHI